jgi:ComF family protein
MKNPWTDLQKLPGRHVPRWTASFWEWAFPQGCAICGKALRPGTEALCGLCGPCGESLEAAWSVPARCSRCGRELISERGTCLSCRNGPDRAFDGIFPLFPYSGPYRKILKAYKFGGRLCLGNFFAAQLLRALAERFGPLLAAGRTERRGAHDAAWTPVPPRPGKIKYTGWDQVEYLAGRLEKKHREKDGDFFTLPVCRCLERLPSESQKELGREKRRLNLQGRIILSSKKGAGKGALPAVPRRAVLLDDVYTTGSTMEACAETLKQGGAEEVYGICICYD